MTKAEAEALRITKRCRRRLDLLEDETARDLARQYNAVSGLILADLRKLLQTDSPEPLLFRFDRDVAPVITARLETYTETAAASMANLSEQAGQIGAESADRSARCVVPKDQQHWNRISLSGIFTGGLFKAGRDALQKVPAQITEKIRELVGTAVGMAEQGIDWLMSKIGETLSGLWSGLQRIVRTVAEQIFRQAQQEQRQQTPVQHWRRVANHETACLACLMLEGTVYERFEDFSDHPNGRCYVVPCEPGATSEPTGRQWLEEQDDATQRRILGKTRYEAWKAGDLSLDQMTDVRPDATFGPQPHVIPLRDLGLTAGK